MPGGPDPAIPFAFVADLEHPELEPDERHHLHRVRRLRVGAPLTVGDGAGRFRAVTFGPTLDVAGPIESVPVPAPPITIGFAITKGDKPELVVQKLTELAVDRLQPFVAERSITRWDADKAARNVARWRVIAREAAAQAHRPHLPVVEDVVTFAEAATTSVCLADPDGDAIDRTCTTILVGPEGGWSPAELAAVRRRVRLGPHVLRAETAALAAGALAVTARAS